MRNPTRRNKNIGTAKQGHGQNNKNVISSRWSDERIYWEKLEEYQVVKRKIHSKTYTFLVEKTRTSCIYSCTVDDISRMISLLDSADLKGLDLIVFRQPKRKEETLKPVWGRLLYYVEIGEHAGPAIMLESFDLSQTIKWGRKLKVDDKKEFDRMIADGYEIQEHKRGFTLIPTIDGLRNTQLYRTFIHEVGHYVDYLRRVKNPSEVSDDEDAYFKNWEKYDQLSSKEKEDFAHGFAERIFNELKQKGQAPFERILDPISIEKDNLRMQDFAF